MPTIASTTSGRWRASGFPTGCTSLSATGLTLQVVGEGAGGGGAHQIPAVSLTSSDTTNLKLESCTAMARAYAPAFLEVSAGGFRLQ